MVKWTDQISGSDNTAKGRNRYLKDRWELRPWNSRECGAFQTIGACQPRLPISGTHPFFQPVVSDRRPNFSGCELSAAMKMALRPHAGRETLAEQLSCFDLSAANFI